MQELNKDLSIYLKMLRVKHSLSQEELANKLGISRQCYTSWESNPIKLDLNQLIKIGESMGEDILIFFNEYVAKSNVKEN